MSMSQQVMIEEETLHNLFLMFTIGGEDFGIDIKHVTEIIGMQPMKKKYKVPKYIKGVINLRSQNVPIIDTRLRFRKQNSEFTSRTSIVVIHTDQICVGLIVDKVCDVLSIDDKDVAPPPNFGFGLGINTEYVMGIGKVGQGVKVLLNANKLFRDEEVDLLSKIK